MTNKPADSKATETDRELEANARAPHYDRGIIPAETAARQEREGSDFMDLPNKEDEANAKTDTQTNPESIDTTGGYTVDKEGLLNNYAIEPEMYYEQPGDLRQKEEEEAARRAQELAALKDEDEDGKLTPEEDKRPKGPGII